MRGSRGVLAILLVVGALGLDALGGQPDPKELEPGLILEGFEVEELAPGVTFDYVKERTAGNIVFAADTD